MANSFVNIDCAVFKNNSCRVLASLPNKMPVNCSLLYLELLTVRMVTAAVESIDWKKKTKIMR